MPRLLFLLAYVLLSGCATPVAKDVSPEADNIVAKAALSQTVAQVTVDPGGASGRAPGNVVANIEASLNRALLNFDYLQPARAKARYRIEARLANLDWSMVCSECRMSVRLDVAVVDASGKRLAESRITGVGKAVLSEELIGVNRNGLAMVRAVHDVTSRFISFLNDASLPP